MQKSTAEYALITNDSQYGSLHELNVFFQKKKVLLFLPHPLPTPQAIVYHPQLYDNREISIFIYLLLGPCPQHLYYSLISSRVIRAPGPNFNLHWLPKLHL